MRILLFLFFIFSIANSELKIGYTPINEQNFEIEYLFDANNSLKIDEIKNSFFKTTSNSASFGINHNTTWYRLRLNNTTDISKKIYFHNNFAYMSKEIQIFEFIESKLINQSMYRLFDDNIAKKLAGSSVVVEITLPPHVTKSIYVKNSSPIFQFINFEIYDKYNSTQAIINKNLYSNILLSILLTLTLYNIVLFIFSRRKEYIFYSLYLFNATLGLFYMYGTIYNNFNVYGLDAYLFNFSAILVCPLLTIFILTLFNIEIKYKRLKYALHSILFFSLIYIILAIFINYDIAIKSVGLLFSYTFIILVIFATHLIKTRHPLSKIFIFAYLTYILGMGLTLYMLIGFTNYSSWIFHASGVALAIEALLFSYLLNYRVKLLEDKIHKQKNVLVLKNKKAQIGDMLGAIAHQWKQPLTAIASVNMSLEFKLKQKSEISPQYLEEKVKEIDEMVHFLTETIDDFRNFFHPNRVYENIDLSNIVKRAVLLSHEEMLSKDIDVKIDLNFTKKINVYPNELLHIILNLMQNSKDAFENSAIEHKIIKIIGFTQDNHTIIDIVDNAGGIDENVLKNIFDENYTTKVEKVGSGLGLYLAKFILQEHLGGSIEAKQIDNGVVFRITL
ncbi:MAG: sensor histidine kinase [Campylobacterota bacterium]|nr:sensor histidine kinase [Campylobacterota bacterium]